MLDSVNKGGTVSGTVDELLSQLTLEEKCRMLSGEDEWLIPGCERLGIPGWRVSDGPVGVRGRDAFGSGLVFPGPSAMAATWDIELVEAIGAALGVECIDKDVDLLLAPTVNLHRSPRGGRHFEMFSEDPELSARLAVAYVKGVQSVGVGACIKHFIGNEQEHERLTIDTIIDERTLRETYLRPFEAAVNEADVKSVMGAYNFVNGHHACAQPDLLDDILKGEWHFEGVVVSDWGAIKETVAPARHGLDVEMPGPGRWWGSGKLLETVEGGAVVAELVDDKVRRILRFLEWRGRLPGETTTAGERHVDRPEHRELARRVAAEAMVLIRNDGLLPLDPSGSVALIGHGAAATALQGGGSANLQPTHSSTILAAFTDRWTGDVVQAGGVDVSRSAPSIPKAWIGPEGITAELYDGFGFDGEPIDVQVVPRVHSYWFGDSFPEGIDELSVRLSFAMTPDVSGPHRLVGAGFGWTRLLVDGAVLTDNEVDPFPAGLGLTGSAGTLDLVEGRTYQLVLEQHPKPDERPVALTDVQIAVPAIDPEARLRAAEAAAAAADVAVVVVGSNSEWESEGMDRADLVLPAGQDELVRRVVAANPRTVVVLNCGAPVLLPWIDDVAALLLAWYPGQEGGDAVLDVLTGAADPAGRMPTTWPTAEADAPSYRYYPGEGGTVTYGEGNLIGHRWYDAHRIAPLVPFGHGGSYAEFEWGSPVVSGEGAALTVEVPVSNRSDRPGTEVVQVYVAAHEPAVERPPKVLGGFAKLRLAGGATGTASVRIRSRAFARWDVDAAEWVVDPGRYDLIVAASAVDERSRIAHRING
jgi:beta-glucosidase